MSDGSDKGITAEQRHELLARMRTPFLTFVGLMGLLTVNAVTGWFQVFHNVWILNLGVLVLMIATVLLLSMEVVRDPPLVRFFSMLGFGWVGILFTMVLIDYLTR